MVALFATVVFGGTQPEVKPADLPRCINDWLMKNMAGYTVAKSYKIDQKGMISYVVSATKGKDGQQWLVFGKECISVKKISSDEAQALINLPPAPPTIKPLPPAKEPPTTTKPPK